MKDEKLYRLTFSRSLAEFLAGDTYEIRIFNVVRGRIIARKERSASGLYGIVSASKHKLLRISLSKDHANLLCGDASRYLIECTLAPVA